MIILNNRMYLATRFYCSGIELAALALSAAGTGAQVYAGQQERHASENAAQAELDRQKKFQREAQSEFEKSVQQSTPDVAKQQMDAGTQKALAEYEKTTNIPLSISSAPGQITNNSQNVVQQKAQEGNIAQQGQSRAQLQGYTAWDLQQSIKNLRAMQEQQRIANFARGSVGVLPLELQQAARSQENLRALGMGLSALGSLGGIYGAMSATPSIATTSGQVANIVPTSVSGPDMNLYNYDNLGFNQQPLYNPMSNWLYNNNQPTWRF